MDESNFITDEAGERPMFTSRRHRRRAPERTAGAIILVTLFLAAAGGGWLWHRSHAAQAAPTEAPMFPAVADPSTPSAQAPTSRPADLPELDASDAFVRNLVSGLSARPQLASWLATDGLVHRFVLAVVDVAYGRSPGSPLAFLSPERPFRAQVSDGRLVVDPSSYHRYDALAVTFASLDTEGTARLYNRLYPLMDDAYRTLGLGDASFQETLARAFGRMLAVRFPETPPELAHPTVAYIYADEALENLSPAEKDFLRLGPDNGRRIQAKLTELAAAMGVQPVAPAGRGR